MQGSGAVKRISEALRLERGRPAAPIINFESAIGITRRYDAPGHDLQALLGNHPRDCVRDLGCDAVTVNVPPRPRMTHEPPLLFRAQSLPQRVAIGSQAVDGRAPTHLGTAPA